ncbi:MAG: hypothetical protein ACJ71P_00180, partial [Nitrososphaeraceae archaeon]
MADNSNNNSSSASQHEVGEVSSSNKENNNDNNNYFSFKYTESGGVKFYTSRSQKIFIFANSWLI